MKNAEAPNHARILKLLPSVDDLLQTQTARKILPETGARSLTKFTRQALDSIRQNLREKVSGTGDDETNFSRENLLSEAEANLKNLWRDEKRAALQKVINATGVIVHTNLGRAPLSENAARALVETAAGYCNLEYDLASGKRGQRGANVEKLLAEITGAESALVVNNCAAAAFLVLKVFASGGEAIISRGELVEIGGDFRVPDVLEQSGAILKEVGTTNRTKLADYEDAVGANTKMLMRVHPSNYRIVGFTHAPDLTELVRLAHNHDLVFYEDAGSGALVDFSRDGLTDEPLIQTSIKAGADIVTFSGDKLLGGVQSGLIAGKKDQIEKLRKHPLYRALRVDKLIYAALAATLEAFGRETEREEIPVLAMIGMTTEKLNARIEKFAEKLRANVPENSAWQIEIVEGNSVIGGGSAPAFQPASPLLAVRHTEKSTARLEEDLRFSATPVIARIVEDKVLLDLRTISKSDEAVLEKILLDLFQI